MTKTRPREEDALHPDILRQLAAEHTRDLITEAVRRGGPVKPATPTGVGWQLT